MEEKRTVLIAEDEPDNREVMRTVVEDIGGYRVLLAEDGEQAIQLIETAFPDLVLIDLLLPRLTGFDVMRRLRANPRTAHIPVVAITALGRSQDKEEALAAGAVDLVEKPFDVDGLLRRIQAAMPGTD
ncbi:MAG: response regulator [Chloroflexota bacterium]